MFFVQINHTGKGFLFLIFREIKLRKYSSLHKIFYGLEKIWSQQEGEAFEFSFQKQKTQEFTKNNEFLCFYIRAKNRVSSQTLFLQSKNRGLQTLQSSLLISRTQIKCLSTLKAPGLMGVSICGIFYISIERIIIIFDIQYHNSTSFLNLGLLFFFVK